MQKALPSLRHISKNFGEGDVLSDVSLDVHKGEFVTLLGASGCSRMMTLRIVSDMETPDSGEAQSSIWDEETHRVFREAGITLL